MKVFLKNKKVFSRYLLIHFEYILIIGNMQHRDWKKTGYLVSSKISASGELQNGYIGLHYNQFGPFEPLAKNNLERVRRRKREKCVLRQREGKTNQGTGERMSCERGASTAEWKQFRREENFQSQARIPSSVVVLLRPLEISIRRWNIAQMKQRTTGFILSGVRSLYASAELNSERHNYKAYWKINDF